MERSNLVRTAADLERKHDFSQLKVLKKNYELNKLGLNKVENEINNFVKATTKHLEELQNQVDGNITTWFYNGVPTIENNPAINWSTENEKVNHLGDLYYDQNTGYAYRWAYENESFVWSKIVDADVVKALAVANAAQDTADKKRQVFIEQPSPPYDVGDLWIKDNELYRCQTTKENEETFENNDWIIATKYTDDTVANQVGNKLTILSGTVTEIRKDVDELNTTMTNTTSLVNSQGEKIGTLEIKTSETSQTVDEISVSVTKIGKEIIPTGTVSGSAIYIEDSADNKLIDFEIEGKSIQDGTPTPDEPVEIKSVGYENLIPNWTFETVPSISNGNDVSLASGGASDYIKIDNSIDHLLSFKSSFNESFSYYVIYYDSNKTFLGFKSFSSSKEYVETNVSDNNYYSSSNYIRIRIDLKSENLSEQMLEKGTVKHSYIPFGKYGVEVETVGENLFDSENWYKTLNAISQVSMKKEVVNGIEYYKFKPDAIYNYQYMKGQFKENTQYTISAKARNYDYDDRKSSGFYFIYTDGTSSGAYIDMTLEEYDYIVTSEPGKTIEYIRLGYAYNDYVLVRNIMMVEGIIEKEYKQYQSYTSVIVLNEPLRSLPNLGKDTYKNGVTTRKIDKYIFSGSEEIGLTILDNAYCFYVFNNTIPNMKTIEHQKMCNCFKYEYKGFREASMPSICENTIGAANKLVVFKTNGEQGTTVEEFKNWLVNNNVEVIYELAEPYTENLGEFEMPSTYGNVTHITTTDVLQPVMNIQYVRDTTLSEYVEGQIGNAISIQERKFAELEITTDSIQAIVSEVSTNLNNNYTPTEELDQILENQKNSITTEMTTKYQQDMSSFSFEIIKKINEDGVTTLKNTMVSIDEKGIHTAKNNEDVVSLLDNKGVYVSDGPLKDDESNVLMKTDRDGAFFKASNTVGTIKEQDIIQKEKIDDEDFGVCQGWYWIGDEN